MRGPTRALAAALVWFASCGDSRAVVDGRVDGAVADGGVADGGIDAAPAQRSVAAWRSSAAGDRLARLAAVPVASGGAPSIATFTIRDDRPDQVIDGFGASFLEAGMVCLSSLPAPAQEEVLRAIFDPVAGAGFSLMKVPIGACDYQAGLMDPGHVAQPGAECADDGVRDWYSYAETPDPTLASFSIERDLGPHGTLTYIRRARAAGGQFRLEAPMDYPPDWMLVDGDPAQTVDPRHQDTLARYLLAFAEAYRAEGVTIDYLSPFNEPQTVYTKISFADVADFVAEHLGPTFAASGTPTRLMTPEAARRRVAGAELPQFLDDPRVARHIAVAAYHGYDEVEEDGALHFDKIAALHRDHPEIPIWQTERSYRSHDDAFEVGAGWGDMIASDLEAGAAAWIYWNLILDQHGGPWLISEEHVNPPCNPQPPLVRIDRQTHTVTYRGAFYYLAHFAKHVRPGALRLQVTTDDQPPATLRALAFRDPGGAHVVQLLNGTDDDEVVTLRGDGIDLRLALPRISITTLVVAPPVSPPP